jgi:DNA polymerase I-like protein with 3'-5' exonuclease and polymerase domains
MVDEREQLRRELVGLFPNWMERLPDFIPKRNNKTQGYIAGVPVERWREHEFNPSSRDHIADRLRAKYGWKPESFTDGGKPTIDDEVLSKLPYPEAQKLARSFLLDKRIGQLAEGAQAWLNVSKEGKIHASYNTNGAVSGRSTHSHPNISQVPRVSSPFGRECRALFHVPRGWVLIGADQSGLELRCLASDMAAFDGGNYATVVTQGDVHTTNQLAAGLPTRDAAKTFIYATLYGGGDEKIGSIVGKGAGAGKALKAAFRANTPGYTELVDTVKTAAKRGWIKGIDGRKMPVRSDHAALNLRLQNSGAIICKQWGADAEEAMLEAGLRHGWDGDFAFVSWSHDEYQVACRDDPATIAIVRKCLEETGARAGEPFNFKCPLGAETKLGANWAETH